MNRNTLGLLAALLAVSTHSSFAFQSPHVNPGSRRPRFRNKGAQPDLLGDATMHEQDSFRLIRTPTGDGQGLIHRFSNEDGVPVIVVTSVAHVAGTPDLTLELTYADEDQRDRDFFRFDADMVMAALGASITSGGIGCICGNCPPGAE